MSRLSEIKDKLFFEKQCLFNGFSCNHFIRLPYNIYYSFPAILIVSSFLILIFSRIFQMEDILVIQYAHVLDSKALCHRF